MICKYAIALQFILAFEHFLLSSLAECLFWLIDWLIGALRSRQHKIGQFVPIYQGRLLAQAFEDSQRGTYKNTQLHAIQWTYACNDKQQVCLTCVKIHNAYNKLHDPEWVKNASGSATPSLSIVHNYVSAFTANKPDPTPCTVIYSLGVVAVLRHASKCMSDNCQNLLGLAVTDVTL